MVNHPVRIAVDVMGGDYAPSEILDGAVEGARLYGVHILLVGLPDILEQELKRHSLDGISYEIIPASEVIGMGESPGAALRKKKDASIIVTAKCVKTGQAQGMVAAGSTGAAMASALLYIGRIEGVSRPAIGVLLPSASNRCLLIDAGANADCAPELLKQFAVLGNVYMQNVHQVAKPRVGLLNIGEEEGKGNSFAHAAFELLEKDPRYSFIGNVEGRDLFLGGVDVAVTDGFTGNVALKAVEGIMKMFGSILKKEMKGSVRTKLGYLLSEPAFKNASKYVDPEEFGGALLLGIQGICVISHGGSRARGIKNAIRVAREAVLANVMGKITDEIKKEIDLTVNQ